MVGLRHCSRARVSIPPASSWCLCCAAHLHREPLLALAAEPLCSPDDSDVVASTATPSATAAAANSPGAASAVPATPTRSGARRRGFPVWSRASEVAAIAADNAALRSELEVPRAIVPQRHPPYYLPPTDGYPRPSPCPFSIDLPSASLRLFLSDVCCLARSASRSDAFVRLACLGSACTDLTVLLLLMGVHARMCSG